jgi:hypothetical protein
MTCDSDEFLVCVRQLRSQVLSNPFRTRSSIVLICGGRVARGDYSPQAPIDLDVRNKRIRFLWLQVRYATKDRVDYPGGRNSPESSRARTREKVSWEGMPFSRARC